MKLHRLPSRRDKDAMDAAHRMRVVLADDVEEDRKAEAIHEMDAELNAAQIILDAWSYLSSEDRRAWKLYVKKGKGQKHDHRY